ncbi:hypothetical protein [Amycolatopsis jejuensis]|uniref:hypothetical protein n=1 Tax=Amycolatopsis jejuensis TaxID=330084 RepID=UPI00068DF5D5|nr:hypothetical protein [Amycolatopsis jejuensis]
MAARIGISAALLGFGGLVTACGGTAGSALPAAVTPAAPTATSAVVNSAAPAAKPPVAKPPVAKKTEPPSNGSRTTDGRHPDPGDPVGPDVNCGKVDMPNGRQADLIAEETKAGIPGCQEAITVISDYFEQAPTKSEGTAHVLTLNDWQCMADTGAGGSGAVACDKDGRVFYTKP